MNREYKKEGKLKLQYGHYKDWLIAIILVLITSIIGLSQVEDSLFKTHLRLFTLLFSSLLIICAFKFRDCYDRLLKFYGGKEEKEFPKIKKILIAISVIVFLICEWLIFIKQLSYIPIIIMISWVLFIIWWFKKIK